MLPSIILFCLLSIINAQKIKHVVVLMQENRPFDHFFGWSSDLLKVNGLKGDEYNLVDPSDPQSQRVYVDNKAEFVTPCDPSHGTPATTSKIYSTASSLDGTIADNGGFVNYENKSNAATNYCMVMSGFPPEKVPIITTLAQEYAIMDNFFASHPGPTWPNRMFALSATSAGSTETSAWYHNIKGKLYPQKTFFDQIDEVELEWKLYYNDTPWELYMKKVAHNPSNLHRMDTFFSDCEKGTLPAFSWINPRSGINSTSGLGSNDQHPDHDVSLGEAYIKDIYEAIRSSPAWEETLFVVTWDEHGGYYDHVIPPSNNIPGPGDNEESYPDPGFEFNRLGLRVPVLLISPWIKKGTVLSKPERSYMPAFNSEYEFTSIISTARKLLPGMTKLPSLTKRDEWSATFEFVLDSLEEPRKDCPIHLPDALEPTYPSEDESNLPLNDLQKHIAEVHSFLADVPLLTHTTQRDHSSSVQEHFLIHAKKTMLWQESKIFNDRVLLVQPRTSYRSGIDDSAWYLNGLKHGDYGPYVNSTAPFITISTKNLHVDLHPFTPYCLSATGIVEGSPISISACYPSANPETNRDVLQHFLMTYDSKLQFYNPDPDAVPLCVTNHDPGMQDTTDSTDPTYLLTLEKCDDRVEQSYAYHGTAPGEKGGGFLEYGDYDYCLGVLTNE